MIPEFQKLGIIAGAGELPLQIVRSCQERSRPYHLLAVEEFVGDLPDNIPKTIHPLSKLGASVRTLRNNGCRDVVFAGQFFRPRDRQIRLRPDWHAVIFLLKNFGVLRRSNDGIHRAIASTFAGHGFNVVSPLEAAPDLGAPQGCIGSIEPNESVRESFAQALSAAKSHGLTGQGQAIVYSKGRIIATELRAGTDAMLNNMQDRELSDAFLVKAMSPNQLPTMDPPAIGSHTLEAAAKAGLIGILVEAGRTIVVNPNLVRAKADELGLFVFGGRLQQ